MGVIAQPRENKFSMYQKPWIKILTVIICLFLAINLVACGKKIPEITGTPRPGWIAMNNPAACGGVSNSSFLSMLTPQGAGNLTLEKIKGDRSQL